MLIAEEGVARQRAPVARTTGPIRIALVGCGTIAEEFHLPVLAGHDRARLAALVDPNDARVRKIAGSYRVGTVCRDVADLPKDIDAAILATPPFHHAPGAIALMRRGVHVLVEKPMALDQAQAEEMCSVAAAEGVVLSVGLYKRLLPVTRLLKAMVEDERYGRPIAFTMEWGGIGGYASATLGLLKKELAGGGVLIDLGSHVFDQLLAVFGGDISIDSYRDDARGGIEADCEATVSVLRPVGRVGGTIRLSRVRNLSNRLRIECEAAVLEAAVNERFEVTVRPVDGGPPLVVRDVDQTDVPWYESYRAEVDDFLSAIESGSQPQLSGTSVLPTVRAIQACYALRQPLSVPWLDQVRSTSTTRTTGTPRRVLITGAGGFIGGRAADILALREGWEVRALVHRPASAGRLARLPVELVQGDLKSDEDVRRAVQGCQAVVHCAIGTAYGSPRDIYSVTVDGTRRLAAAARAAGVERFVHISSIAVHGSDYEGTIDEAAPVSLRRDDWYGYTKVLAERAIRSEEGLGLSAAILRPGCVYGPYGFTFVMNPLQALARGLLVLEDSADTPANTVFVDNLIEAILCGLNAPADAVRGHAFAIGDGDSCTWGEYYDFFGERLKQPVPRTTAGIDGHAQSSSNGLLKNVADVFLSAEAKAFAKRVLQSDPLGTAPRYLLDRYPALEMRLRQLAGMNEPTIYRRPAAQGPGELIRVRARKSRISIEGARKRLGYRPPVSAPQARALTWEWAQYARIV